MVETTYTNLDADYKNPTTVGFTGGVDVNAAVAELNVPSSTSTPPAQTVAQAPTTTTTPAPSTDAPAVAEKPAPTASTDSDAPQLSEKAQEAKRIRLEQLAQSEAFFKDDKTKVNHRLLTEKERENFIKQIDESREKLNGLNNKELENEYVNIQNNVTAVREALIKDADATLEALKKGKTVDGNGQPIAAIPKEDKEALERIENHKATDEDKKKYGEYIKVYEETTNIKQQAINGDEVEVSMMALRKSAASRYDEEAENKKWVDKLSKAAKLFSPELAALLELIGPMLVNQMSGSQERDAPREADTAKQKDDDKKDTSAPAPTSEKTAPSGGDAAKGNEQTSAEVPKKEESFLEKAGDAISGAFKDLKGAFASSISYSGNVPTGESVIPSSGTNMASVKQETYVA